MLSIFYFFQVSYNLLFTVAFVAESHHSHMLIFFNRDLWNGTGDILNWVINKQAQGHFKLDVTFKVLFILYIQYTSQKYWVNLQQRASRYPVKYASGNQIFRWSLQSENNFSSSSPCFYIIQVSKYNAFNAWKYNNRGLYDISYFPVLISQIAVGCQILAKLDVFPDSSGFTARFFSKV